MARSTKVYSSAPRIPACPGFEENALELEGFQDAGSAWTVAVVSTAVKWCSVGRWAGEESRWTLVWRVEKAEFSGELNPAACCSGGWLGYWACQKFQAFEIMPTTEKPMYDFQFFSRWHNLSLVSVLFNDSGNSSLLTTCLLEMCIYFPAHVLVTSPSQKAPLL